MQNGLSRRYDHLNEGSSRFRCGYQGMGISDIKISDMCIDMGDIFDISIFFEDIKIIL